jgi:Cd2+/Zn2+-exporting ATPase
MNKDHQQALSRIVIAAVLFVAALLVPVKNNCRVLLFLIPYAVVGWDVLWKALRNIVRGQVFDENFLMSLATVGAFAIREYPEAVAVGETIVIKAGERIPLDGVVLEGYSTISTAALTGESLPREVAKGGTVISGCN